MRVRRSFLTLGSQDWMTERKRRQFYRLAGMEVGETSVLLGGQKFGPSFFSGKVKIGENCFINKNCWFDPGNSEITIGHDAVLASGVALQCATHDVGGPERRAGEFVCLPVTIGRGCWLGYGVTVLPGVTVAAGCIVGARAVVTRDTAPNGVYAGMPARRMRDLGEPPGPESINGRWRGGGVSSASAAGGIVRRDDARERGGA